jgi:DNA-binding transcriptional regulator YiaG
MVTLRYLNVVSQLISAGNCTDPALKAKQQFDRRALVDGKSLRALRKSCGLSQQQLADLLGVQRVTITRAEGTDTRPSKPSRLLQSLLDQALSRGELRLPREEAKKRSPKKKK